MSNVAALRRTSEQQLDHIRQLEDRERSLGTQVVSMRLQGTRGMRGEKCVTYVLIFFILQD